MTKETFYEVTAELVTSKQGAAVVLTQPDLGYENPCVVQMHPLQLRHFAERFAGMEPVGWLTTQPVKTLTRRLHTLAFHIDFLYSYIKDHSDHKHADLSFELAKALALTEMADEFCADLPDAHADAVESEQPAPATAPKSVPPSGQTALI